MREKIMQETRFSGRDTHDRWLAILASGQRKLFGVQHESAERVQMGILIRKHGVVSVSRVMVLKVNLIVNSDGGGSFLSRDICA